MNNPFPSPTCRSHRRGWGGVISQCSAAFLLTLPHVATAQTSAGETAAPIDIAPLDLTIKETKHEIAASADYMLGIGEVSIPLFFSLDQAPNFSGNTPLAQVQIAERTSTFVGATLSYSLGQAWYVDFNYSSGSHSGDVQTVLDPTSAFEIEENYYQLYFRYAFPKFRGTRFSLYARAGVGFNEAKTKVDSRASQFTDAYSNRNSTKDYLGNLGLGIGYTLFTTTTGSFRIAAQSEIEGFYGRRSQTLVEALGLDPGNQGPPVDIGNDVYGGLGRITARFQLRLNNSGLARAFADLGLQGKYSGINYPTGGTVTEFLWGPYARVGIRYSF